MICPNYKNKEVFDGFNEIIEALGGKPMTEEEFRSSELRNQRTGLDYSAMEATYKMYHANNGNLLDLAPNGKTSILFLTLLSEFNGDRAKAIKAKSAVYSDRFRKWFGDWTGNATYEVYQGRTSELPDGRKYNYWSRYENEAKKYGSNVRKVRINPSGFLFKRELRWRTNLNGERVFDWGWSEEYEKVFAEFKEKTGYDYFDILENSKEGLAKQNEFFEFLESKGYKGYAEFNELELQGVEHDNPYTVTFGDNGIIDSDVSKVVDENGEPLVVYHGNDDSGIKKFKDLKLKNSEIRKYNKELEEFGLKGGYPELKRVHQNGIFFTLSKDFAHNYGRYTYPVFLNIKNPAYERGNYVALNPLPESYDGLIEPNWRKQINTELIVWDANQIKSAIGNIEIEQPGTGFSTTNDDIQKSVLTESEYLEMLDELELSQDKTDDFIYNFYKKILKVNPRYKVDEESSSLVRYYLDSDYFILSDDMDRIDDLAKKIFGYRVFLIYNDRESFIKSIDENIENWINNLQDIIKSSSGVSKFYSERNSIILDIDILNRYLKAKISLSEEEHLRVLYYINKKRSNYSRLTDKQIVGYYILDLKKELRKIQDTIRSANYKHYAKVIAAKNRIVALNTISDLKYLIKQRILSEYDSYKIKDSTRKEKIIPFINLAKSINNAIKSGEIESRTNILIKNQERKEISYEELTNLIHAYDNSYDNLIILFRNANPNLKIKIGGDPEETLFGKIPGKFVPKENELILYNNTDIYTAIHELAHSATYYGMVGYSEENGPFADKINQFMDYIRNYINKNKLDPGLFYPSKAFGFEMPAAVYGFTNPSEFIAELFSNPSFLLLLDNIPPMDNKNFKSLLHEIYDSIIDFLNSLLGKNRIHKSALDQAKELGFVCLKLLLNNLLDIYNQLKDIENKNQFEGSVNNLLRVDNGESICDCSSVSTITGSTQIKQSLQNLNKQDNNFARRALIQHYINKSRDEYVQLQVDQYVSLMHDPSTFDIYGIKIGSAIDWDEQKIKQIIGEQQEKLAKVYGLKKQKKEDGTFIYVSKDKSKNSRLRVAFVNSMTGLDWTDDEGKVHKGLFVEKSKFEEAAWNAIYLSITDGDATTFVHEMIHYYIRTFWDSLVVQDALREVDDNKNVVRTDSEEDRKYSKTLEEKLVNTISESTMWNKNRSLIDKFHDGINNIIKNIIGAPIKQDKNVQANIIDTLNAAFSINQDLSDRKAETIYYYKYAGSVPQSQISPVADQPTEIEGTTFYKIKLTIESRLKSEKSRGKAPGDELEKFIQKLQRRSAFNKENVYDTVVDFLLLATSDVRKAKDALVQLRSYSRELLENLDVEEFMHFRYDIISYYDKMVHDVLNDYLKNNSNIQPEDRRLFERSLSDIKNVINGLKSDFNEILDKYIDIKIEQYGNELVAVGDKDIFIANMKLWVGNQINDGNLMPLENIIGTAVTSYSPIVRLVEYIVTAQNRITYTNALTKGHELIDKYKKCASIGKKLLSINFVKQFCELDDDGNPTGYFIRKYNHGKLYKQRDDLKRKLVKKHNIQVDEETGEILFKNKDLYVKYMTDFYNELDKFANLKYKKDYYIQRAKILSPKTIELQSLIQKQIDIILRKATDEEFGVPFLFNLNEDERNQLDQLNREMLNLSNPYIITYRSDGSIETFEEKAGDMLQVAKELMQWNAYKAGKLKYKSNYEKFNAAREKIKQRFGENSNEDKQFVRKYRVRRITSEFYDLLGMLKSDNQELVELYQRRSAIRNSIMPRRGYILPNLKKLNSQAFAELKRIDERISELLTFNDNDFNEIANKAWIGEYVDGRLTSNPVFNYFQEIEQRLRLSGQIPFDQVSDYMYTNSNGNLKPLSIFKYTLPISESFLEYSLLGEFSELDPTSELLNDKWDAEQKEELQPKNWKEYENKAFAKIYEKGNEALKDFYEAIISTMREAYSMLPNMDVDKMLYVMPQMRDRDAKLLFRNRHVLTNMGASVADAFSITERDTQYNEDFVQRPDGSSVETIPIRWITKLRDPSIISTDIVQTVTMFYEMANNYRNKVEINPLLQAILFKTQGGFGEQAPGTSFSQQSERIKTYLQMYVYGRTRTGMHSDRPMSDKEKRGFRIAETLLSVAHRKLMSHNWRAVLKNLIDSMLTDLAEIYTGKYIDSECALLGVKEMGAEIFSQFSSFGRANNKSKIAALMQLNGCSGTISEIFGQHNETWLRRIISKHASMGEYDLVDYTVKGHYVASLYHSIRLVKNQNTKELEFMTKDQAAYHYLAAGLGMNKGVEMWKKSKFYLFKAYTVDDKGNAVVIDKYEKYVHPYVKSLGRSTNRLVNQVAGTIRERTSVINGILDSANLTRANQLAIGGAILLMRGWMITQGWDNLKDGHDFAEYKTQWEIMLQLIQDDKYAGLYMPGYRKSKKTIDLTKYIISSEDPEFRGQYNFETGSIETGQWRGLKNASVHYIQDFLSSMCTAYKHIRRVENSTEYKNKLTRNERYKLRRLSSIIASFIVMSALIWFTMMLTIKYPERWFLDLLCATNISVISERASQLPVVSLFAILDIINSIIISKSLVEDVDKLIDLVGDIIEVAKSRITDNDDTKYNEEIKTGAYAGRQKWERDLIKATSYTRFNIDNIFRSMTESGNKASINYYIHNVSPTKQVYESSMFFVPALLESLGVDVQEPEWTKQTKKGKSKKSIAF